MITLDITIDAPGSQVIGVIDIILCIWNQCAYSFEYQVVMYPET